MLYKNFHLRGSWEGLKDNSTWVKALYLTAHAADQGLIPDTQTIEFPEHCWVQPWRSRSTMEWPEWILSSTGPEQYHLLGQSIESWLSRPGMAWEGARALIRQVGHLPCRKPTRVQSPTPWMVSNSHQEWFLSTELGVMPEYHWCGPQTTTTKEWLGGTSQPHPIPTLPRTLFLPPSTCLHPPSLKKKI